LDEYLLLRYTGLAQKQDRETYQNILQPKELPMSYKALLYAVLLVSNVTLAQIKIDLDMTINERHVTQEAVLDAAGDIVLDCNDLIVTLHIQELESDQGVYIQTDIREKSEIDKDQYIAQPVIIAQWDKDATVTVGTRNENGEHEDTFKIVVKASRI
jgi:hypothetical protein